MTGLKGAKDERKERKMLVNEEIAKVVREGLIHLGQDPKKFGLVRVSPEEHILTRGILGLRIFEDLVEDTPWIFHEQLNKFIHTVLEYEAT